MTIDRDAFLCWYSTGKVLGRAQFTSAASQRSCEGIGHDPRSWRGGKGRLKNQDAGCGRARRRMADYAAKVVGVGLLKGVGPSRKSLQQQTCARSIAFNSRRSRPCCCLAQPRSRTPAPSSLRFAAQSLASTSSIQSLQRESSLARPLLH